MTSDYQFLKRERDWHIRDLMAHMNAYRATFKALLKINKAFIKEEGCEYLRNLKSTYNCRTPEEVCLKGVLENITGPIEESSDPQVEPPPSDTEASGTKDSKPTTTISKSTGGKQKAP